MKSQEKVYGTKAITLPDESGDDLRDLANDLTNILAAMYRECKDDQYELADVRIKWVTNPEKADQGKFVLKAKRKAKPLIVGPMGPHG